MTYQATKESAMQKTTVHYVTFLAPGAFFGESWTQPVESADPRKVVWPVNAYAFTMHRREDVIDGDKTYAGKPEKIGKTYYHQDSSVQSLDEARTNPKATPILLDNMRINGWKQIIWTRWGNWPQPFDPSESEVLR